MPRFVRGFIAFTGWANLFGVAIAGLLSLFAAYHHEWGILLSQVLTMGVFGIIAVMCLHPKMKSRHEAWWTR